MLYMPKRRIVKLTYVGHTYQFKEEAKEQEFRSPLEKHIKKDKKPTGLNYKYLISMEDI